jgi:hypothetical protein
MASTDPSKISPKVILATAAAIVAAGVLASLNYLITPEGQQLFAALPPVVTVGLMAIITGAASALAGYLKADPARQGSLAQQSEQRSLESDPGAAPDVEVNQAAEETDPGADV